MKWLGQLAALDKNGYCQISYPQAGDRRRVFDPFPKGPIEYEFSLFDLLSNFPDRDRWKPNAALSNGILNGSCGLFGKAAIFSDPPHPCVSIKKRPHPTFLRC